MYLGLEPLHGILKLSRERESSDCLVSGCARVNEKEILVASFLLVHEFFSHVHRKNLQSVKQAFLVVGKKTGT